MTANVPGKGRSLDDRTLALKKFPIRKEGRGFYLLAFGWVLLWILAGDGRNETGVTEVTQNEG